MDKIREILNISLLLLAILASLTGIYAIQLITHADNALIKENTLLREEIAKLRETKPIQKKEEPKKLYSLKVSAYTPSKRECDSTPHITALNKKSRPGKTCAVGTDCLELLGSEVYIKGLGTFHCTDIKPSKGLDVMVGTVKEARKIGNSLRTVVNIKETK